MPSVEASMAAAGALLGSLLVSLLMTQKTIWPGESFFSPTVLGTIFAAGGNMLETCTRLNFSMPASRRASSNEVSSSLWMPTPFVKKTLLGTNIFSTPGYGCMMKAGCCPAVEPSVNFRPFLELPVVLEDLQRVAVPRLRAFLCPRVYPARAGVIGGKGCVQVLVAALQGREVMDAHLHVGIRVEERLLALPVDVEL